MTNEVVYYLLPTRDNAWTLSYFPSFPSCYASVMKRNVNLVVLNNTKDIARTVKTLFKVKLQAVLYSLQLYQKGTFPSHNFLGIFR